MSRRLPSARIHHENMETNQAIKGDLRNKFVFVFFISFGFMFSLFYFHSTPLTNISIYVSAPDTKLVKETVIDHVVPYSKPVMETVIEHVVPDTKPVTEHVVRDTKSFTETTVTEHVVPDTKPVTETDIEHAVSNKKPVTEHVVPDTKPVTETTVIEHVVLDTKPVTETEHVVSNTKPVMETTAEHVSDPCAGRYIYVHELPSRFNDDMLKRCRTLSLWTDMCRFTSNSGLGPQLDNSQGVFSDTGWYATNQFAVDVIFDNRMKQYRCLTPNSSSASAIFVPFYAGFDVSRYLWGYNTSMRDSASLDLVKWLTTRPEWKVMGGRDHFLVGGRITWDFRRVTDNDSDWGNKLLFLPETKNMSMLVVESSPWSNNDYGIPYPTYFHPSKDIEVFQWQERMRRLKRPWLFSFAGAPRPGMTQSIRGSLIDQCRASRKCRLLECDLGESKCHSPSSIMKMFQSSIFCLQPQGDSYTRRSAFDSMLTGCIPVFFHPGSAYVQYTWHLPKNYTLYSVFIPEDDVRDGNVSIEKRLLEINVEDVRAMREQVIRLIPRLIYADPRSRLEKVEDAFDVAVKAVIDKVNRLRNGVDDVGFEESDNWKYNLLGRVGEHEWDKFFSQPKQANS